MNPSEWAFILSGIAGVLLLAFMGALHVRGIRARDLDHERPEGDGGHEVRAVVPRAEVDDALKRLATLHVRDVALLPLDAVRHPLGAESEGDGAVRLEVTVDDEGDAWDVAEMLRALDSNAPVSIHSLDETLD